MEKANNLPAFNNFFKKQCQPIPNDSKLPSTLSFETTDYLSAIDIWKEKISTIIQTSK